jgi:hypothetical protein
MPRDTLTLVETPDQIRESLEAFNLDATANVEADDFCRHELLGILSGRRTFRSREVCRVSTDGLHLLRRRPQCPAHFLSAAGQFKTTVIDEADGASAGIGTIKR